MWQLGHYILLWNLPAWQGMRLGNQSNRWTDLPLLLVARSISNSHAAKYYSNYSSRPDQVSV
jgi:hypothetical protein